MATTRRNALKSGLAALGGLVGLGAAARAGIQIGGASSTVRMHVRATQGRDGVPRPGERRTARADLLDAPAGRPIGELHGATFTLRGPGGPPGELDRMEFHTFVLSEGTIVGSGVAGADAGEFAVVGGTGRYAGARGTYAITAHDEETAEVVLSLIV